MDFKMSVDEMISKLDGACGRLLITAMKDPVVRKKMRDIKFRGKRIDNGEWVYGAFVPDVLETPDNDLVTWGFIRRYNRDIGKMETIEVSRESVGQYTGLCDKNGKEIYEGDVVRIDDLGIGIVDYEEGRFAMRRREERFCWPVYCRIDHSPFVPEVIGNIYDNPELLD